MGALFRVCVLAIAIGIAATGQVFAQADAIREVRVEGNQRIDIETVESYMTVGVGDPFDRSEIDQSLKKLFRSGLFSDVSIRRDGDALLVVVVENPVINRLAFEGNKRIEDATLEAEVQLRARVVYTRAKVQSDVQRLLQVYRRSGRFSASIEPKVIQLPQNRVDLVFEINEGPLTEITRINFIGNRVFDDGDLRDEIATKESRWYRFFTSDDTYDPDRLALDRELLRRFYLKNGYADIRIVSAVAELTPDRKGFFITFTIDEGEHYNFGKVDVATELKDIDKEQMAALVKTESGEGYDAALVEETIQEMTFALGRFGYAFVDIRPRVKRNREDLTIDLTYAIAEGPRVYVERIDITGNVRTLDEVIRREFRLVEGDAFNTAKIRRSRERIQSLGFFDKVEVSQTEGSSPDQTVINVDVNERATGELSFGIGFSTTETVIGDVSLRERNLLGRGQDLKLSLGVSSQRQQVDLSFTEPYFMDRNVAAGFDIFHRRSDFQDESSFDIDSTGGRLRVGFPLSEFFRTDLKYGYRVDKISDIADSASVFIKSEAGSRTTSSVGYSLTYDSRDNRFDPKTGNYLRFGQEVAGLGGNINFLRSDLTMAHYQPLFGDVVGSISLETGYIFGLDQDVRLSDRYFLGGNSFRGFERSGVGPRDNVTQDSLGGNLMAVSTAELRFPLGLPDEYAIVGRLFSIAGTLTEPDLAGPTLFDEPSVRVSAGFGISWRSPFGPIRMDFTQALVKEDLDRDEFFRFSFGTRF